MDSMLTYCDRCVQMQVHQRVIYGLLNNKTNKEILAFRIQFDVRGGDDLSTRLIGHTVHSVNTFGTFDEN